MLSAIIATLLKTAGLGGLVMATGMDFKTRMIPDETTLWVGLLGLGSRVVEDGWHAWISLLIAFAVVLPLGFLSRRGVLGGGDAKLIAAVTLLFTPALVPPLILVIALAGGVLSIGYIAAYRMIPPSAIAGEPVHQSLDTAIRVRHVGLMVGERTRVAAREPPPYAIAILAGVVCIFVEEILRCLPATSS